MPVTAEIGTALIVGDEELEDRYIADLMALEGVSFAERNPIVKVRFVLRYPMQHAICWNDVACENRAVDNGVICRLRFYGIASAEQLDRFGSYEESLAAALEERLLQARRDGDSMTEEIILRHIGGEYRRSRILTTYKEYEIKCRSSITSKRT